MKRTSNPLKALLLAMAISVSCTPVSPIPKNTLQKIYYDMLLVDSMLDSYPDLRMKTDSMSVYPAIFERYGYTAEQFMQAQDYWVSRPEEFRKMLESNKKLFDERAAVLSREMEVRDSIADALFALKEAEQAELENFLDSISFACRLDTIRVSFSADTFTVAVLDHAADTSAVDTSAVDTTMVGTSAVDTAGAGSTVTSPKVLEHKEPAVKSKEKKLRNTRKRQLKEIEEKFK